MNELLEQFLDFVSVKFGDGKNCNLWSGIITNNENFPDTVWDDCVEDIVKQVVRKGAIEVWNEIEKHYGNFCQYVGALVNSHETMSQVAKEKLSSLKNNA